jgi:hypothetical protein
MAYLTGVRTPGRLMLPQGLPSENNAREMVLFRRVICVLNAIRASNLRRRRSGESIRRRTRAADDYQRCARRCCANDHRNAHHIRDARPRGEVQRFIEAKEAALLPAFKNASGQSKMKLYDCAAKTA